MSNPRDRELKNRVENAIEKDYELNKLYDVNVDVTEEEVQLVGVVDTLSEKETAEKLVKRVPGVNYLNNNLTVCTDGAITDRGVEFEVGEELHADPKVDPNIGVISRHGKAFLVGRCDDKKAIKAAANAAARARGVKQVISQVRPTEKDISKDIFHSQVRNDGVDHKRPDNPH